MRRVSHFCAPRSEHGRAWREWLRGTYSASLDYRRPYSDSESDPRSIIGMGSSSSSSCTGAAAAGVTCAVGTTVEDVDGAPDAAVLVGVGIGGGGNGVCGARWAKVGTEGGWEGSVEEIGGTGTRDGGAAGGATGVTSTCMLTASAYRDRAVPEIFAASSVCTGVLDAAFGTTMCGG